MTYDLVIGDRAYSSWSLRGWLLFDAFGIPVKLHRARLYTRPFRPTAVGHPGQRRPAPALHDQRRPAGAGDAPARRHTPAGASRCGLFGDAAAAHRPQQEKGLRGL